MDPIMRLRARVGLAVFPHPRGSSARVWAAHKAVEDATRDGILCRPPEWHGPRECTVHLPGSIRQINITAMVV